MFPNGNKPHRVAAPRLPRLHSRAEATDRRAVALLSVPSRFLRVLRSPVVVDPWSEHVTQPRVGIIMGSRSDRETMQEAARTLDELGIAYEMEIVSAHRTPDRMFRY